MPMEDICSAAAVVSILIPLVPKQTTKGIYGQRSLHFWWVFCCCCSSSSFPGWKSTSFPGKMELTSGKYSHHNVFTMVCMVLEFLSCCPVAAVAFLPHEFLSVEPTVSPGCINPGHLIRGRPQIAIICYNNIVQYSTHNGTKPHIPHQIEQYSKALLVDSMVHCPNRMWMIVYSIVWNPHNQITDCY